MKVKEIFKSKEYWINRNQGLMYKALRDYFENSERGEQSRISKKLGFGKSYISQLLNGYLSFDHKESTRVELALAIGLVPIIQFVPVEQFIQKQVKTEIDCLELKQLGELEWKFSNKNDIFSNTKDIKEVNDVMGFM